MLLAVPFDWDGECVHQAFSMILTDKKTKLIKLGLLLICLLWLYFPVFHSLIEDWIHLQDFSHGFLVPFIALFIAWRRRQEIELATVNPSWLGAVLLMLGLILLILGDLAAESFTMRISFLIVLTGTILFLLGRTHLKLLIFPIAFMLLMIPVPSILMQKITFPMQLFASRVAKESLSLVGIPVLREGNIIQLEHISLQIAEACSGIRSLISLITLGVVFAYFSQQLFWKRALLVIACFPVAIIVNALRVSATGLLAQWYGRTVAQGFFHGFSGYLLFLVAFVILFILGLGLSKVDRTAPDKAVSGR